jgi:hypothetical protein
MLCSQWGRQFDDLTGSLFTGRHQPLQTWIACLYLMGEVTRINWHGERGLSFLQCGLQKLNRLCYQQLSFPTLKTFAKGKPSPTCASQRKGEALKGRIEFSKAIVCSCS